jgi:hypothetical protein
MKRLLREILLREIKFFSKKVMFHILLGLFIRELFAFWTGHPWDFEVWARVGKIVAHGYNPYIILSHDSEISFSPYKEMESIGYPPLPSYIFALSYLLYRFVTDNIGFNSKLIYYFFLKQPIIFSDVLVGTLLYKYTKTKTHTLIPNILYTFWLYNPYCILLSAVWGSLDPISILFVFLAIILFENRNHLLSGMCLGISTAVKTFPLIFLPIFLVYILKPGSHIKSHMPKFFLGFVIALSISILVPFKLNNWNWSGFYNSMIYQAQLPVYGGVSPFLVLEYVKKDIPPLLHNILSSLWITILVAIYFYSWKKETTLTCSLLISSIGFIISRIFTSESLILYPIIFAMISGECCRTTIKKRLLSLTPLSFANLMANNTLLIRFITPIYTEAFDIDIYLNNTEPMASIRLTLREILALLLFQEFLSIMFDEEPLVIKITRTLSTSDKKAIIGYCFFFALSLFLGLGIDYTVINMVTDWHTVLDQPFLLGLDLLSTYHLFLAIFFLTWILTIVLLKKGTRAEKLKTFLVLVVLVIISAGVALAIFQYLRTGNLLTGEQLILVKGILIQDRVFFVLALSCISTLPAIIGLDSLLNRIKSKRS